MYIWHTYQFMLDLISLKLFEIKIHFKVSKIFFPLIHAGDPKYNPNSYKLTFDDLSL